MKRLRLLISKNIPNLIVASGAFGFFGLLYTSEQMSRNLDHPVIEEALRNIAQNDEAVSMIGSEFKIRKNIISMTQSKALLDSPFGEAKFIIRTPKGDFQVIINTSSHTLKSLESSNNTDFNYRKFYIPNDELGKIIKTTPDKEDLKKMILKPTDRFTAIDFINVINKKEGNIIIKPKVSENVAAVASKQNLYDVYIDLLVSL
jgi:hypothetical protein